MFNKLRERMYESARKEILDNIDEAITTLEWLQVSLQNNNNNLEHYLISASEKLGKIGASCKIMKLFMK